MHVDTKNICRNLFAKNSVQKQLIAHMNMFLYMGVQAMGHNEHIHAPVLRC